MKRYPRPASGRITIWQIIQRYWHLFFFYLLTGLKPHFGILMFKQKTKDAKELQNMFPVDEAYVVPVNWSLTHPTGHWQEKKPKLSGNGKAWWQVSLFFLRWSSDQFTLVVFYIYTYFWQRGEGVDTTQLQGIQDAALWISWLPSQHFILHVTGTWICF